MRRAALCLAACAVACGSEALGPSGVADGGLAAEDGGGRSEDAALLDAPSLDAALDAALADAAPGDAPGDARPRGLTRYPLVLTHGFAASPGVFGYERIGVDLETAGYDVYVAAVPPFDSSEVRGSTLALEVDRALARFGAPKVNVIAHSQGGLDALHMISTLGYGDRVASLSTIGTPYRGSAIADVTLGLQAGSASAAVDALVGVFGRRISDVDSDAHVRASLLAVSENAAPAFVAARPDDPRVLYQSWAGLSNVLGIAGPNDTDPCDGMLLFSPSVRDRMDAALVGIAAIVAHGPRLYPNDGMVRIDSAKHGRFRGCIAADHADEVGAFNDVPPDPRTGFDVFGFYRALAAELAASGL